MSRILKPDKRLIVPGYRSYRNLDEACRRSKPEDGHSIDLMATLEVKDPNGFSQGRHTFRCHSFVRQMIDWLVLNMAERSGTVIDYAGNSRTVWGSAIYGSPNYNFDCVAAANWCWHGPVCGTGTTAATISDWKMEKQVTHGTAVPNASITTGTGTSRTWTDPTYLLTKSAAGWGVNAYVNDFLAFTNGAANGLEFPICSNAAATISCYDSNGGTALTMDAFPPVDPGATPTFTIKTYGMLVHGSVAFTAPTDDGALQSKFSISRDFTNNQGAAFTVNEVGLQTALNVKVSSSYYLMPFLVARDVLGSPVALNNAQVMTLTYSIIVNA